MSPMTLAALQDSQRVLVRRDGRPDASGQVVVYWMQRAQRAVDNPALDVAVHAANALQQPVVVFLAPVPLYPHGNLRHYQFLFDGFEELAPALARRRVGFVFRQHPDHRLIPFCDEVRASLVVGDENYLREPNQWRSTVAKDLKVPFWTVDADVIVPTCLLEREQYAARTIRPRLRKWLPEFLVSRREPTATVKWQEPVQSRCQRVVATVPAGFPVDRSVLPVRSVRGGTTVGRTVLRSFIKHRLPGYASSRNRPELNTTSQVSPYLHFGHLGPRMVALAVRKAVGVAVEDREAFLEELIVRRELAINFVRYNPRYDQLAGCEPWALRTLHEHGDDLRRPVYAEQELEQAVTHDPLWNAAQRQMVETGWMHGYLRMYWAKKILEWTATPEDAFAVAIRLNDRYELDGRDPNGYAGIAWALGGKHDRAWGPERPIFGKVRYMSYESTRRKFDSRSYIARWLTD